MLTSLSVQSVRPLSQWSAHYAEPVSDLAQVEQAMDSELAFCAIKARPSALSCSLFFDPMFNRFVDKVHIKGHKALARDLMRETFAVIKRTQLDKYMSANHTNDDQKNEIQCDPLIIFHTAIENCRPLILNWPIKRGGATYQVPYPLKVKDSEDIAIRWLIHAVRERPKPRTTYFPEAMAKELIDAFYNEGKVVKKKQDVHRVCEANRAYAHYRWGWLYRSLFMAPNDDFRAKKLQ